MACEQLYQLTGVYVQSYKYTLTNIHSHHIIHPLVHVFSMLEMDGRSKIGHRTTIRKTQYNTFASHFTVICLCFAGISLSITMVTSSPTKHHFLLGCAMFLFMYFVVYACSLAHTLILYTQYIEYKFSDSGKKFTEVNWLQCKPVKPPKTKQSLHNTQ